MNSPLIHTQNVTKIYGAGETAVYALDDVSIDIEAGEFLAIMGPSGCGKSTLLNMLGALDQPTRGQVWVASENLAHLKDVDTFRAHTVGFIFQLHNLLPTLTAVENVETPMQGRVVGRKEQRARAENLLELVGMAERAHHLPSQLSGGQRQRVAVARALANEPALILADEPTGSLDSQSGKEIMELLSDLNQQRGTTIAVVTHDRQVAQTTGRILYMHDGQIVNDHIIDDPYEEDLFSLARSRLGQALMGGNGIDIAKMTFDEEQMLRTLLGRIGESTVEY